jgi:hypothetical protein
MKERAASEGRRSGENCNVSGETQYENIHKMMKLTLGLIASEYEI